MEAFKKNKMRDSFGNYSSGLPSGKEKNNRHPKYGWNQAE